MFAVNYLLDLGEVKEKSTVEANVKNFLLPLNGQVAQWRDVLGLSNSKDLLISPCFHALTETYLR